MRRLLLHLESVGFDGAPRFLGTDEKGRDVLSFIAGDVPLPPYPAWALSDAALQDLGRLVRRFHEATADFDAASVTGWSETWSDPSGGSVVCHNDLPGRPCGGTATASGVRRPMIDGWSTSDGRSSTRSGTPGQLDPRSVRR